MKHLKGAIAQDPTAMKPKIVAVVLAVAALLSVTVCAGFFSSTDTYQDMFKKLDDKRNTVLTLTAASATASAALTLIPDDTCTPIAEQLAEISKDFSFVVAALLLEKYLLTIIGFVFFTFVLPLSLVAFAASQFMERGTPVRRVFITTATRFLAFGLVLFIATPASIFVTDRIDATYQESIDATVNNAQKLSEAVEVFTKTEETEREAAKDPLEFIQQQLEGLESFANKTVASATGALEWVKGLLGGFIEAFAVMLVTSIIIPILVPIVIYLAFKILIGQQEIIVQQAVPALPPKHEE